jgi:hypothetical protein
MPRPATLTALLALALLAPACGGRQVTLTPRSGIEQELLVRSLERSLAELEVTALQGQRVTLDLYGLTGDAPFAREFIGARLAARGVRVVTESAGLRLRVFATVLGVDRGETLLGIPALQVPLLAFPLPEIALFKWVRHRGLVELQAFTFDAATGDFIARIPDSVGRAKFDQFTLLLIVSFTVTDLDERPAGGDDPAGGPR